MTINGEGKREVDIFQSNAIWSQSKHVEASIAKLLALETCLSASSKADVQPLLLSEMRSAERIDMSLRLDMFLGTPHAKCSLCMSQDHVGSSADVK